MKLLKERGGPASTPIGRLYRERSLAKVRRFAHRFPFGQVQINATERRKEFMYCLCEISRRLRDRAVQRCAEYFPGFFFHRTAVMRRTDAQFHLCFIVDLANRQHCHKSMLALLSMNASDLTLRPWLSLFLRSAGAPHRTGSQPRRHRRSRRWALPHPC